MSSRRFCYINGEVSPMKDGVIGISDLALQRGYGVFDYSRTYNGKLFRFDEHIERLRRSAAELHLHVPISTPEIVAVATDLIERSVLEHPCIRLILTGGDSEPNPTLLHPNFIVLAEELPRYAPEAYEHGAKLITMEFQRELPQVKSINYMNAIRMDPIRRELKAFDILYHSDCGITECPRSNFFAFLSDTLVTPSQNVLLGITRKVLLELSLGKFAIEERPVRLDELAGADEAFVTSTSKRIVPVSQIDRRRIGDGCVGRKTRELMSVFDDYTCAY